MSDYKRYISYLYRYEDKLSSDNVGFVKLEAKAGEVKLVVSIKTIDINGCELEIGVLYNRDVLDVNDDNNVINEDIATISIENVVCDNSEYSNTYRTNMTNVFNSGVNIDRIIGVIIKTNKNSVYMSKWNESEIKINNVLDNPSKEDVIMNLNEVNECRIVRENIDEPNDKDEEKNKYYEYKKESLENRIFRNYPGMYPFEDDEVLECVKLEPHDIGIFSMDKWPLANNSFLLHGYYTYRHLIFAKMKHTNKAKYVLGVPGIFRDRERFMASMFGFRGFKGVRNKPLATGEFGYWYLEIKL